MPTWAGLYSPNGIRLTIMRPSRGTVLFVSVDCVPPIFFPHTTLTVNAEIRIFDDREACRACEFVQDFYKAVEGLIFALEE